MRERTGDKRDRLRQLRIFCETARLRSLTRAAERLGLTQPAVSLQVRELEYESQAVLLERDAAGVALTEAGERLYALAAPLVQGMDALFGDVRATLDAGPAQWVHIAASSTGSAFVLPGCIARFRERHPDEAVRVDTVWRFENRLGRLLDEQVDLVLSVREPYPQDTLLYHELCTYGLVLITPLDHPLAGRASVSPREARAHRSVVPAPGTVSGASVETALREFGIDVNASVEVGGWGMLKRYVEAGIGISIVPNLCVNAADQLSVIPLDAHVPARSYGVFALRDRHLTPAARRFLKVLVPNASEPSPP